MHRFLSFYMNALRGKGGKILCDPFSKFDLNLFATCAYDIITGVKKFCEMNFSICFIDGEKIILVSGGKKCQMYRTIFLNSFFFLSENR